MHQPRTEVDPLAGVRVFTEDARQLNMCADGVTNWFRGAPDKATGLRAGGYEIPGSGFTLRDFATKGIPARQFLEGSGYDAMALRIVRHVCKRDGIEVELP